MSTLKDTNELEFAKIEEIANSETDCPVFMLNLNKYFDRGRFINQDEKYNKYIKTVYAILYEIGGKMLWRSPVHDQMVGKQGIDEIWAVWYFSHAVWYPSHKAFLGLKDVPTAAKSFTLKRQIVERAIIHRCDPYLNRE